MSNFETQTPVPEQLEHPSDDFDDILSIQDSSRAARNVIELPVAEPEQAEAEIDTPVANRAPLTTGQRITRGLVRGAAGVAAASAIGAGIGVGISAATNTPPDAFSDKTTTVTVGANGDMYGVAQTIPGINTVNILDAIDHIEGDPVNIDVLKDGLQPGERVTVPVSINGAEPTEEK